MQSILHLKGDRVFRGRVTPTYVCIIDESFDKGLHVLKLLSSLQQEHHIHRLLTRHWTKISSQIITSQGLMVD